MMTTILGWKTDRLHQLCDEDDDGAVDVCLNMCSMPSRPGSATTQSKKLHADNGAHEERDHQ